MELFGQPTSQSVSDCVSRTRKVIKEDTQHPPAPVWPSCVLPPPHIFLSRKVSGGQDSENNWSPIWLLELKGWVTLVLKTPTNLKSKTHSHRGGRHIQQKLNSHWPLRYDINETQLLVYIFIYNYINQNIIFIPLYIIYMIFNISYTSQYITCYIIMYVIYNLTYKYNYIN